MEQFTLAGDLMAHGRVRALFRDLDDAQSEYSTAVLFVIAAMRTVTEEAPQLVDIMEQAGNIRTHVTSLQRSVTDMTGRGPSAMRSASTSADRWMAGIEQVASASRGSDLGITTMDDAKTRVDNMITSASTMLTQLETVSASLVTSSASLQGTVFGSTLAPVSSYASSLTDTLRMVGAIVNDTSMESFPAAVEAMVRLQSELASEWDLFASEQAGSDAAKSAAKQNFAKAVSSLTDLVIPLQSAALRLQRALASDALRDIDALTASYLSPSLVLNAPGSFAASSTVAKRRFDALPAAARTAFGEVNAALTAFAQAACASSLPALKQARQGLLASFSVPAALPMGSSSTAKLAIPALSSTLDATKAAVDQAVMLSQRASAGGVLDSASLRAKLINDLVPAQTTLTSTARTSVLPRLARTKDSLSALLSQLDQVQARIEFARTISSEAARAVAWGNSKGGASDAPGSGGPLDILTPLAALFNLSQALSYKALPSVNTYLGGSFPAFVTSSASLAQAAQVWMASNFSKNMDEMVAAFADLPITLNETAPFIADIAAFTHKANALQEATRDFEFVQFALADGLNATNQLLGAIYSSLKSAAKLDVIPGALIAIDGAIGYSLELVDILGKVGLLIPGLNTSTGTAPRLLLDSFAPVSNVSFDMEPYAKQPGRVIGHAAFFKDAASTSALLNDVFTYEPSDIFDHGRMLQGDSNTLTSSSTATATPSATATSTATTTPSRSIGASMSATRAVTRSRTRSPSPSTGSAPSPTSSPARNASQILADSRMWEPAWTPTAQDQSVMVGEILSGRAALVLTVAQGFLRDALSVGSVSSMAEMHTLFRRYFTSQLLAATLAVDSTVTAALATLASVRMDVRNAIEDIGNATDVIISLVDNTAAPIKKLTDVTASVVSAGASFSDLGAWMASSQASVDAIEQARISGTNPSKGGMAPLVPASGPLTSAKQSLSAAAQFLTGLSSLALDGKAGLLNDSIAAYTEVKTVLESVDYTNMLASALGSRGSGQAATVNALRSALAAVAVDTSADSSVLGSASALLTSLGPLLSDNAAASSIAGLTGGLSIYWSTVDQLDSFWKSSRTAAAGGQQGPSLPWSVNISSCPVALPTDAAASCTSSAASAYSAATSALLTDFRGVVASLRTDALYEGPLTTAARDVAIAAQSISTPGLRAIAAGVNASSLTSIYASVSSIGRLFTSGISPIATRYLQLVPGIRRELMQSADEQNGTVLSVLSTSMKVVLADWEATVMPSLTFLTDLSIIVGAVTDRAAVVDGIALIENAVHPLSSQVAPIAAALRDASDQYAALISSLPWARELSLPPNSGISSSLQSALQIVGNISVMQALKAAPPSATYDFRSAAAQLDALRPVVLAVYATITGMNRSFHSLSAQLQTLSNRSNFGTDVDDVDTTEATALAAASLLETYASTWLNADSSVAGSVASLTNADYVWSLAIWFTDAVSVAQSALSSALRPSRVGEPDSLLTGVVAMQSVVTDVVALMRSADAARPCYARFASVAAQASSTLGSLATDASGIAAKLTSDSLVAAVTSLYAYSSALSRLKSLAVSITQALGTSEGLTEQSMGRFSESATALASELSAANIGPALELVAALSSRVSDINGIGCSPRIYTDVDAVAARVLASISGSSGAPLQGIFAPMFSDASLASLRSSLTSARNLLSTVANAPVAGPVQALTASSRRLAEFFKAEAILKDFVGVDSMINLMPYADSASAALTQAISFVSFTGRVLAAPLRNGSLEAQQSAEDVASSLPDLTSAARAALAASLPAPGEMDSLFAASRSSSNLRDTIKATIPRVLLAVPSTDSLDLTVAGVADDITVDEVVPLITIIRGLPSQAMIDADVTAGSAFLYTMASNASLTALAQLQQAASDIAAASGLTLLQSTDASVLPFEFTQDGVSTTLAAREINEVGPAIRYASAQLTVVFNMLMDTSASCLTDAANFTIRNDRAQNASLIAQLLTVSYGSALANHSDMFIELLQLLTTIGTTAVRDTASSIQHFRAAGSTLSANSASLARLSTVPKALAQYAPNLLATVGPAADVIDGMDALAQVAPVFLSKLVPVDSALQSVLESGSLAGVISAQPALVAAKNASELMARAATNIIAVCSEDYLASIAAAAEAYETALTLLGQASRSFPTSATTLDADIGRVRSFLDTTLKSFVAVSRMLDSAQRLGSNGLQRLSSITSQLRTKLRPDGIHSSVALSDASRLGTALTNAGLLYNPSKQVDWPSLPTSLLNWSAALRSLLSDRDFAWLLREQFKSALYMVGLQSAEAASFMSAAGRDGILSQVVNSLAKINEVYAFKPTLVADLSSRASGDLRMRLDNNTVDRIDFLTRTIREVTSNVTTILYHPLHFLEAFSPIPANASVLRRLSNSLLSGMPSAEALSTAAPQLRSIRNSGLLSGSASDYIEQVAAAADTAAGAIPLSSRLSSGLAGASVLASGGQTLAAAEGILSVNFHLGRLGGLMGDLLRFYSNESMYLDVEIADKMLLNTTTTIDDVITSTRLLADASLRLRALEELASFVRAVAVLDDLFPLLGLDAPAPGVLPEPLSAAELASLAASLVPSITPQIAAAIDAFGVNGAKAVSRASLTAAEAAAESRFLSATASSSLLLRSTEWLRSLYRDMAVNGGWSDMNCIVEAIASSGVLTSACRARYGSANLLARLKLGAVDPATAALSALTPTVANDTAALARAQALAVAAYTSAASFPSSSLIGKPLQGLGAAASALAAASSPSLGTSTQSALSVLGPYLDSVGISSLFGGDAAYLKLSAAAVASAVTAAATPGVTSGPASSSLATLLRLQPIVEAIQSSTSISSKLLSAAVNIASSSQVLLDQTDIVMTFFEPGSNATAGEVFSDLLAALSRLRLNLPEIKDLFNGMLATLRQLSGSGTSLALVDKSSQALDVISRTSSAVSASLGSVHSAVQRAGAAAARLAAAARTPSTAVTALASAAEQLATTESSAAVSPSWLADLVAKTSNSATLLQAVSAMHGVLPGDASFMTPIDAVLTAAAELERIQRGATVVKGALESSRRLIDVHRALLRDLPMLGQQRLSQGAGRLSTFMSSVDAIAAPLDSAWAFINASGPDMPPPALLNGAASFVLNAEAVALQVAASAATGSSTFTSTLSALNQALNSSAASDIRAVIDVLSSVFPAFATTISLSVNSTSDRSALGMGAALSGRLTSDPTALARRLQTSLNLVDLLTTMSSSVSVNTPSAVKAAVAFVDQSVISRAQQLRVLIASADHPLQPLAQAVTGAFGAGYASFHGGYLLDGARAYFNQVDAVISTMEGMQPVLASLVQTGGGSGSCAASPVRPLSLETRRVIRADVIQCAALATTGTLQTAVNFTLTLSYAGSDVIVDTTQCNSVEASPGSAVSDLGRLFTGTAPEMIQLMQGADALSNPSTLYGIVAGSVPRLPPAAGDASPRLGYLGFCFAPSVTAGPCASVRDSLLTAIDGLVTSATRAVSLSVPAADGLAEAFAAVPALLSGIRSRSLPALTSLVNGSGVFVQEILTGTVVDIDDRRHASTVLDHKLNGLSSFASSIEQRVVSCGNRAASLNQNSIAIVASSLQTVVNVSAPVSRSLASSFSFLTKVLAARPYVMQLQQYLRLSDGVKAVGDLAFPVVRGVNSGLSRLKSSPLTRSPAALAATLESLFKVEEIAPTALAQWEIQLPYINAVSLVGLHAELLGRQWLGDCRLIICS